MQGRIDTTTYRRTRRSHQAKLKFEEDRNTEWQALVVSEGAYDQTWLGFGGAATEAAAWTWRQLGEENRQMVLDLYFSDKEAGYTLARGSVDSCDFSLDMYEAMSDPGDRTMQSFSLSRDESFVIPFVQAAGEHAGQPVSLLLSPWSPPAFMKSNGKRVHGGRLLPEYYDWWADYLCRYIKGYRDRGLRVDRLSIQNEPNASQTWDSCTYTAAEERTFLTQHLYPALQREGLGDVKVLIWDHNKERLYERVKAVLEGEARDMAGGIAFHWYTGNHFDQLRLTHERFPEKELIHTEGCVGFAAQTPQLDAAEQYAFDIMGNLNAGMQGYIDWNLLLDERGGPNHVENFCAAPMICDTKKDTVDVQLMYYYIRHFSHYIRPGARRLWTSSYLPDLDLTAFENPDGRISVVVLNRTRERQRFNLRIGGQTAVAEMPRRSISTIVIDRD